jgi:WNK lysine deficient protein kinase
LKRVRHPNIITFHDSWYSNGELVFITEMMTSGNLREYTLLMAFYVMILFSYVSKLKNPNLKIIKRWGKQLLKGLFYLHSHAPPILHRDIKCDNIFINGSHGEVKIGDMGTAKMRFGKKYTVIGTMSLFSCCLYLRMSAFVGTPEFMAPEMYDEKGYSEKVDIYAFGMCLLEMATGQYPYSECKNAAQIYKKVSQGLKPDCLALVEDKETLAVINACLAPEEER